MPTNTGCERRRKQSAILLAACAMLSALLLLPVAAQAVECSNGGAGPNPAGNDHGVNNATACGNGADANGAFATALGSATTATGAAATAIAGTANGDFATAVGNLSNANGTSATALGNQSAAVGTYAVSVGNSANAASDHATALGTSAQATGTDTTAVGYNAQAIATNSVAIGSGSVANQANTVSVGSTGNERRITNVAPGVNSTDAVNVSQLNSVTNSFASAFNSQIANLQSQIDANQQEARRGIAAAVATASAPMPSRPGHLSWQFRGSTFEGEYGLGFGVAYRLNTAVPLAIVGGYGNGGGVEHTGYVGLQGEF